MTFRSTQTVEAIQVRSNNAREVNRFLTEHMAPAEAHGADAWLVRCPGRNKVAARGDWIVVAGDRRIDVLDDGTFAGLFNEDESTDPLPGTELTEDEYLASTQAAAEQAARRTDRDRDYAALIRYITANLPQIHAQLGITPATVGAENITPGELAIKALEDYLHPMLEVPAPPDLIGPGR